MTIRTVLSILVLALLTAAPLAAQAPNTVDHAGILANLDQDNYQNGERIYTNLCVNCHGANGQRASLPTARAFGEGTLRFGTDPYSMFLTLTEGNGLMGAQTWLTPQERYDVIHYIRERFMKPMNPAYKPIDAAYLADLPKVEALPAHEPVDTVRDFGPALASQLTRDISNVLTVDLGDDMTVSYNLHTMDLVGAWKGGFLDLSETQHFRLRGEGVPLPGGDPVRGLDQWAWAHDGTFDYPTNHLLPRGPMPTEWMDYKGHYLYNDEIVLSYSINGRDILELPGKAEGFDALVHTLRVAPSDEALMLNVGQLDAPGAIYEGLAPINSQILKFSGKKGRANGRMAISGRLAKNGLGPFVAAAALGEIADLVWTVDAEHQLVLHIPASDQPQTFQIIRYSGTGLADVQSLSGYLNLKQIQDEVPDLESYLHGGSLRWPDVLTTEGRLGSDEPAYTLDTITLPASNPWNAWFRTSALDFMEDGRMVVTTHGGDVWIVSGLDADLDQIQWKRFASGLYEPFGVKVVDGVIYVTCKDRLVRLMDLNDDGEADFYESFSADTDVSTFFHAYNFDLHVDHEGNFYYAKAGQYTSHALPGAVIKISPDGKTREVYCTGFRTPNGMGILPDDRLTISDNQGNWIPASKVNLIKPGGFYGYVQTHTSPGYWEPDGGRIDVTQVVPPDTFDQPIIWMPQDYDNSSGGQVWVGDERWGPLAGRLLHTSFGKGWLYYLMIQEVGSVAQSAIIRLPLDFEAGIMRARVNPADGQVYATGLNGWNGGGRPGLTEGSIQRVRYTGRPMHLITDVKVRSEGLEVRFNFELDDAATDPAKYRIEQWNYKWQASYGSEHWSVADPGTTGHDPVPVSRAELLPDGQSVLLHIPDIQPVNQMLMYVDVHPTGGTLYQNEVYLTINAVPERE